MGHKLRKNHGISASGLTCLGFELEDQFSIEIPLETSSNWRSVKQVVATVEAILGQL
jgi:acyl carrier protein